MADDRPEYVQREQNKSVLVQLVQQYELQRAQDLRMLAQLREQHAVQRAQRAQDRAELAQLRKKLAQMEVKLEQALEKRKRETERLYAQIPPRRQRKHDSDASDDDAEGQSSTKKMKFESEFWRVQGYLVLRSVQSTHDGQSRCWMCQADFSQAATPASGVIASNT